MVVYSDPTLNLHGHAKERAALMWTDQDGMRYHIWLTIKDDRLKMIEEGGYLSSDVIFKNKPEDQKPVYGRYVAPVKLRLTIKKNKQLALEMIQRAHDLGLVASARLDAMEKEIEENRERRRQQRNQLATDIRNSSKFLFDIDASEVSNEAILVFLEDALKKLVLK